MGCGVASLEDNVGASFNDKVKNEGRHGIFVMEWRDEQFIRSFYFPDAFVPYLPPDLGAVIAGTDVYLNPDAWVETTIQPYAHFTIGPTANGNGCRNRFRNQHIIINIALCGDWAGNTWSVNCDEECIVNGKCDGAMNKCIEFVKSD